MACSTTQRVIIAGGSISGLCAAIVLLTLRKHISIYEHSHDLSERDQGAGIVVGDELLEFIQYFNVTTMPWTLTSKERQVIDQNGKVIHCEPRQQHIATWRSLYSMLRARADYLSGGTEYYFQGSRVIKFREINSARVEVEVADSIQRCTKVVTADLLIAADGANSFIRQCLAPTVQREMVEYIAWRGMVPQSELSTDTKEKLSDRLTFYHGRGTQLVVYSIPSAVPYSSEKLLNFVWYCNCPPSSAKYQDIMLDCNNVRHHVTMPSGLLRSEIWTQELDLASRILPPILADLVAKVHSPFAQGITDVVSPRAVWMSGKVILSGDALAGLRPHTGASTNQAALHALALWKWLKSPESEGYGYEEFEKTVMHYAQEMIQVGQLLGAECQESIEESAFS